MTAAAMENFIVTERFGDGCLIFEEKELEVGMKDWTGLFKENLLKESAMEKG